MVDPEQNPCLDIACPLRDGPDSEDSAIYPELARANLHRIHGEYREAADVCRKILRTYPGNLTAHTLMGDIAAEDGQLNEATEWYELALDLEPDRVPERRKLESVRRRLGEQEAAATAEQLGIPTQAPRARLFAISTVAFVALVGVGGFFLNDFVRSRTAPVSVIRTPITVQSPAPTGSVSGEEANAKNPATGTAETTPSAPSPGAAAALPDTDVEVLGGIRARVEGGDQVLAALADPRNGNITITVNAQGVDPRRVATDLGMAVLDAFPTAMQVTVRVSEAGRLALVADVLREDVRAAREQNNQAGQSGDAGTPREQAVLREEWTPQVQPTPAPSR